MLFNIKHACSVKSKAFYKHILSQDKVIKSLKVLIKLIFRNLTANQGFAQK